MDFLDPEKKRAHRIRLLIGYVLIGILIILSAILLAYQASGYGFNKKGQLIQNGLVFINSTPSGSSIYLNGVLSGSKTNTSLMLPAGQYTLSLKRSGYRTWVRSLGVEGGSVERFAYPFLFPTTLTAKAINTYSSLPGLAAQSPDRRWLLVQEPGSNDSFDLYDLNTRAQSRVAVTVPADLLPTPAGTQSWQLVEWANDNRHVLLLHQYTGGSEYILLDRQTPADSINLTKTLNLAATAQVTLSNHRYDHYFIYDNSTQALTTANLKAPTPVPLLSQVLAFKTYGDGTVLYATSAAALSGKANVRLLAGGKDYQLRVVAAGGPYLLSLSSYGNTLFAALGAASEDKVYVYKDPVAALASSANGPLVPITILKVTEPTVVSFSTNSRFIMTENGQAFAVYDADNDKTYSYQLTVPVDATVHATWMDGAHLTLVSDGKVVVFDYDGANQQSLNAATPGTVPYFDSKYQYLYALAPDSTPAATGGTVFTSTPLTTPAIP